MEEETKQENGKKKVILLFALIIAIILGGIYFYIQSAYISTDDAYVDTTTVQVSPKVSGQLVEVLVNDNEHVKKGQLIAVIEDNDYKIKVVQAKAKYEQALQNQKNAKANHTAMQTQIDIARADFERYKHSYEEGAVSKQEYDVAKAKYDSAKANLVNTQEALITQNGKSVADAQIAELKALKDQAELYLSYTKIYAPADGTVASKRATEGMYVAPGSPLFAIVPNDVWVVANFKENQLTNIQEGQKVSIKVDTFPNVKFKGRIDSIQRASGAKASLFPPENAVGSFVKVVQRIPVKIVFEDMPEEYAHRIVPGMSVTPKVRVK